jgi:hypothetical protein
VYVKLIFLGSQAAMQSQGWGFNNIDFLGGGAGNSVCPSDNIPFFCGATSGVSTPSVQIQLPGTGTMTGSLEYGNSCCGMVAVYVNGQQVSNTQSSKNRATVTFTYTGGHSLEIRGESTNADTCHCSGVADSIGRGADCMDSYNGNTWCYTPMDACSDGQLSVYGSEWSVLACNPPTAGALLCTYGGKCVPVINIFRLDVDCDAFTCEIGPDDKCLTCRDPLTTDDQCASCNPGYKLVGTGCESKFTCEIGPFDKCKTCRTPLTADDQCASCNDGYELIGTECHFISLCGDSGDLMSGAAVGSVIPNIPTECICAHRCATYPGPPFCKHWYALFL